jgi:hypothetical protein
MLWIWPLVTLAMVAVVAFFVTAELAESTRGRVERTLACPGDAAEATVLFQSDFFEPGRYRSVVACSRFPAGQQPSCALACLGLGKPAVEAQSSLRLPVLHG